MKSYTPDILEGKYARFLLRVGTCPECGRSMIVRPERAWDTFPYYFRLNFEAQAEAGGFCIQSGAKANDRYICEDCMQAGRSWFRCDLCGQKMSSDKIEECFGDPPDCLCSDCYASVPAKEWDEKRDSLTDKHKWDYG